MFVVLFKTFFHYVQQKRSWPSSCNSLLSDNGLEIMTWIMIITIILPNAFSMLQIANLMQWTEQMSEYEIFVFLINLCDLLTGCYILGIAVKDFVSRENYTETDL